MPHTGRFMDIRRDSSSSELLARGDDLEAHSILQRAGFIAVVRLHETYHRAPAGLTEDDESRLATDAVARLRAAGYHVDCDEPFDTDARPARYPTLGTSVSHLAERLREATDTAEAADILTELTAPHDGILAGLEETLGALTEFFDGLGNATDPHTARRLRYLADEYVRVIHSDLAYTNGWPTGTPLTPAAAPAPSRCPTTSPNAPPCAPAHPRRLHCRPRHNRPSVPPACAAEPLQLPKDTMHDHDTSEHLASYADVLAGELPDTWTSTHLTADAKDDLAELADRIWDLDLVAASLAERPLTQAAVLSRPDGAQLVLLDRHDGRDGFLLAAVAPRALPDEAYRAVPEPNGVALADDPFLSAEQVACDLLARYDRALAQVRHNALGGIQPSQPDRIVLTWQPDGSVATAPADDRAGTILVAHGFIQDPQSGIYRLGGDDTQVQARALREIGPRLDALGIGTALQHPAGRTAPTSAPASVPPTPSGTRTPTARTR